ncbi:hypothetical protein JCGZ_11840 [Jatropha curcas]|uniref:DUF4220 domain-containing protein n=2 Tax=Jatropha curcas TaxID=180498 RepID=A0A067LC02_JATCU|nr:hypothetical protein JCGZ_11840 [Jatropha curcas]
MAIFSDWTAAHLKRSDTLRESDANYLTGLFNALTVKIFFKYLTIRRVFSRRWSNRISGNNLIRYCLKGSPTRIHVSNKRRPYDDLMQINTIFQFSFIDKVIYFIGLKDLVDEMIYVSSEPLTKELWEFIYDDVKRKLVSSCYPESVKEICSCRGEWILRHQHGLMPYIKDVSFDQSILLWHIATEILYNTDEENSNPSTYGNREFSKILSDYLFYLLTIQPNLIAVAMGVRKIRIKKVYVEVERLFKARKLRWNELKKACQSILDMEDNTIMDLTSIASDWAEGRSYRYLVPYASILAKELKKLEEEQHDKWQIMSKVWIEMLCYGVCHCRPYNLVQQLTKGGEFFTFVWLLLTHFGILGT